jgi:hypothetical protein
MSMEKESFFESFQPFSVLSGKSENLYIVSNDDEG